MEINEPEIVGSDNSNNDTSIAPESSTITFLEKVPEECRKSFKAKGWENEESLPKIFKSFHELEKQAGNKVSIPDAEDKEGWNKLYNKLGRPESIEGYEIDDVQDVDAPLMDKFKDFAFNAGLSKSTTNNLYQFFTKIRAENESLADEAFNKQVEKGKSEIKEEWGDKYDENYKTMERGYRFLSPTISDEGITNLEIAIGTKGFMKLGQAIGDLISEDGLINNSKTSSNEMSMEEYAAKVIFGGK